MLIKIRVASCGATGSNYLPSSLCLLTPIHGRSACSFPVSWAPWKPAQSATQVLLSRDHPPVFCSHCEKELTQGWGLRNHRGSYQRVKGKQSPMLALCCGFRTPRHLGMLLGGHETRSNGPRSPGDLHGNFPTLYQGPLRSPFFFSFPSA